MSTQVFPPSLLGKDILTTVLMLPWPPFTLFRWSSPECFQYCLFVTLCWRKQKTNSLDLGHFINEYLKGIITNKNKQIQKYLESLTQQFLEKTQIGRWLDNLRGNTFTVLTPAEHCTCFDVVIYYCLRMAIAGVVRETDCSCLNWNISDWSGKSCK